MKRTLYIYIFALIALITSCDKQADLITSFPFTVEGNYKENIVINTLSETSFELTPEQVVTSNVYTMSYRVLKGKGSFYLHEDAIILENEATEFEGLSLKPLFKAEITGEIEVQITFSDQQGEEETMDVSFIAENNPFSVDLNTVNTMATINESKDFSLILINSGVDKNVTYEASLYVSQGKGVINVLDSEGEIVKVLDQTKTFQIEPGTYNYSVVLTEPGINILTMDVTDSNGQKISDKIEFGVDVIDFNFSGEPSANTTSLGNNVELNFNLNETDGGNADYQMRYILSKGDADIFVGTKSISAGTNVDVFQGAYTWVFKPTEKGEVTLKFIVINSTGVKKEVDVVIDVKDRSFDFTSTGSLTTFPVGNTVNINYVISETGGTSPDSYTMLFSSSANGTLSVGGVEYSPGSLIEVPSLNFSAIYKPSVPGQHKVTTKIKSISNSLEVSKDVSFTVQAPDFNFNITSLSEVTVGEKIDLEFIVNELVGSSTFDMKYSITGPGVEIRNESNIVINPNTDYDISKSFVWSLKGVSPGTSRITFSVINSFGVVKSQTINIEVKAITFDFTVTPNTTSLFTGKNIRFDVDMDAPNSLNYTMKINSNGNSKIIYNNSPFNLNQPFSVTNTDFSILYNSSSSGSNIITFEIEGSNGVKVSKSLNITLRQTIILEEFTAEYLRRSCIPGRQCAGLDLTRNTLSFKITKDPSFSLDRIVITVDGSSRTITNFSSIGPNEYLFENEVYNNNSIWGITSTISIVAYDSSGNSSNRLSGTLSNVETERNFNYTYRTSDITITN